MRKKPSKGPLYRVEVESLERPDQFMETDADHWKTVSTFTDVTPRQLGALYLTLEDDGCTFVDVFRQPAPVGSLGYRWSSKNVFSGTPRELPSELME